MTEEKENLSFLQLLSVVHKRETILTLKIHKLKILQLLESSRQQVGNFFLLLFPTCKKSPNPQITLCKMLEFAGERCPSKITQ